MNVLVVNDPPAESDLQAGKDVENEFLVKEGVMEQNAFPALCLKTHVTQIMGR